MYMRFRRRREQTDEPRSPVTKDRDRIIHSSAFRRLQGKSQILTPQTSDFFRTRLTHTVECAQIGRSIVRQIQDEDSWTPEAASKQDFEDLVEAACLAHDLGHPPFGHNGEDALAAKLADLDHSLFEGNAQSFRVATYTEAAYSGVTQAGTDRWVGLDLTRVALRSICKYPWAEADRDKEGRGGKFNVYNDPIDQEYFDWVWNEEEPTSCLAMRIMDTADDIAYGTHDFEDGVWAGMIPLHALMDHDGDAFRQLELKVLERDRQRPTRVFPGDKIEPALLSLLDQVPKEPWALKPFDRTRKHRQELKHFTARMIGTFVDGVTSAGTFAPPGGELKQWRDLLTGMAWVWMIERSDLATYRFGQQEIVRDLFDGYWAAPEMLPRQEEWRLVQETSSPVGEGWREKARLIRDHIAGMTDAYASEVHQMMHGHRRPSIVALSY
jgi:dGTPase